jgi:hypothetical protein
MKESIQNNIVFLKKDLIFTSILILSLLFFLYKGISYSLVGSFVPLITIAVIILLIVLSSRKSKKAAKRTIGLWIVLIVLWSIVRIALSLINQFVKPVPESHVAEQLGVLGFMQSVIFLVGAIYLWKNKHRVFEK